MQVTNNTLRSFNKFLNELNAFAAETGEQEGLYITLYEDAFTTRMVSDFKLFKNGKLTWWEMELNAGGFYSPHKEEYKHIDNDDVKDTIKFWKACLRRAKKYWSMDCETLDRIHDGELDDIDED